MAARLTLAAARNVPWAPTIELYYDGGALPLAGASVRMQVRLYAGQPGAALLDIAAIEHTDETAATQSAPTRRLLRLYPTASKAQLQAMPTGLNQPEPGQPDTFYHDAIITYGDGAEDRLIAGDFLLEPGITDNG